jgi:hypothetical protein
METYFFTARTRLEPKTAFLTREDLTDLKASAETIKFVRAYITENHDEDNASLDPVFYLNLTMDIEAEDFDSARHAASTAYQEVQEALGTQFETSEDGEVTLVQPKIELGTRSALAHTTSLTSPELRLATKK